MEKVIIAMNGGVVSIISKPNGTEVEIRDYDVDGLWDEENDSCKNDKDGDRYQEIVFSAE